ncbi:MAG: DUF3826 domain-containing protein [Pedosphaera sp.]|nr:DUF3826 domain-containing protein [Pedosphaera sp.]
MIPKFLLPVVAAGAAFAISAAAEENVEKSAPFTAADRELVYSTSIENRTANILKQLSLTDTNKTTRVHDALVAQYRSLRAREEAIDGGSADEKSAIFQKFKDQINAHLNANGHDVAKATREWEAKQKPKEDAAGK